MDDRTVSRRRTASGASHEGDQPIGRNRLLELLPPDERERITSRAEEVEIPLRKVLYEDNKPLSHAYFPHVGVFSMVSRPEDEEGMIIEIATVGNEGMVGLPLMLSGENMPGECFCQISGRASRIEAKAFTKLLGTCPELQRLLLRYTQALMVMIAQSTACNRMHPIEERCARWLLTTRDRVEANHFTLTQEFLGQMLGVRRPSVSIAASMLQQAGLIRYSRGLIVITDRKGLEAASCNCYRVIKDAFERLIR